MKKQSHLLTDNLNKVEKNEHIETEMVEAKRYKVQYDTTRMLVFAVDGVLPYLDEEEGRLIFFTNISSFYKVDRIDKKLHNICVVELRTTPSCMEKILYVLSNEIDKFERFKAKKTEIVEEIKKQKQQTNNIMFG
jgi:hypothetical protein